jgi:hypothetical protein
MSGPSAAPRAPARPPTFAIALALILGVGTALVAGLRPRGPSAGNRLVVINTGGTGLDSIVVEPEPPGANLLAARSGYLAAQDSAWITLPRARGDTDVRVYRGADAVANHAVYFGGNSIFELRIGDRDQLGRYRRMGG